LNGNSFRNVCIIIDCISKQIDQRLKGKPVNNKIKFNTKNYYNINKHSHNIYLPSFSTNTSYASIIDRFTVSICWLPMTTKTTNNQLIFFQYCDFKSNIKTRYLYQCICKLFQNSPSTAITNLQQQQKSTFLQQLQICFQSINTHSFCLFICTELTVNFRILTHNLIKKVRICFVWEKQNRLICSNKNASTQNCQKNNRIISKRYFSSKSFALSIKYNHVSIEFDCRLQ
jgi:hypothetical protein